MSAALYLLLVVMVLVPGTFQAKGKTKKIADYFSVCSRNDPNLSDCVKNSILKSKPKFIEGIPDLQLVPLDPMFIPLLEFKDGQGNFEFSMILKNLNVQGLKDFEVRDCKLDFSNHLMQLDLYTPYLNFDGQYQVKGKILVVPIQGNGDVVFNFTGVSTKAIIKSIPVEKDGAQYLPIDEFKWDLQVETMHSNFSNLFNGDKVLGDSTNKFLNDNSKEAFDTLKLLPEEAFGQFFKEVGNRVFNRFTADELFPK